MYKYVKGQGWIFENPVREFPRHNYDLLCNSCGSRAGEHSAAEKRCPADEWNTFLKTRWS